MANILTKETAEEVKSRFGLAIKKPSQQKTIGICMMLYGQGGAGKTDTVSRVIALGKTLHIDVESGTDVLAGMLDVPDYDILEPKTYPEVTKIIDELKRDVGDYKNIILDNLTEVLTRAETSFGIIGNDSHDLQRYKLVKMEIIKRVVELRELSRKYGINVFIICWDEDNKDERGVLKKDLALTPALRKELPGMINIVAHVRVMTDPDKRTLDLAPSPKTVAKFRRASNSSAWKVPYAIEYGRKDDVLVDVINSIKEGKDWPSKYKQAKTETPTETES